MTLACLQQNILWEQPKANRQHVEEVFAPVGKDADILIVPETFTTGFSDNMAALAESPEGPTLDWARGMAAKHNALFVGTWTVRQDMPGTRTSTSPIVYNRLHYVFPDGTYGYYDKAHTFRMSSEASQLARGTRRVTFSWRGWRIRPAVCYDLRFPIWLRQTLSGDPANTPVLDYDLLLFCANWPASRHEAWNTLLRARAIENICYSVGCNRVGTDGVGIPYSGNSAIVDFRGMDIAAATPNEENLVVATLDRQALDTFRSHWPFYLDADLTLSGDN